MSTSPTAERWVTAEEVLAARQRFVDAMPGYESPVAYSVARCEAGGAWEFAHINDVGGTHALPAAVLATVCGYRAGNAAISLTRHEFASAVRLLSPAEACTAFDHPNLWSWRPLLEQSPTEARFVAIFIGDLETPPASDAESALRQQLAGQTTS
jgi:hypothetical protein